MTDQEIAKLLADENADVVERDEAILNVGRRKLSAFSESVIAFLKHPHAMLRAAAISSLLSFWERSEFLEIAATMAKTDPDVGVRIHAIGSLETYAQIHKDAVPRLLQLLAAMVATDENEDLRNDAYDSFVLFAFKKPEREIYFQKPVHWEILNPYLEPALRRPVAH